MSTVFDVLNKILGDPNKKELKKLWPVVKQVREKGKDPAIESLTLEQLPGKSQEFRTRIQERLAKGEKEQAILNDMLPEVFAVGIRACELLQGHSMQIGNQTLTWNMVPFDVQILGGAALHKGSIAEMRTGEGKTLVCTLPVYLNALVGKGVHVITVNDYLAKRDATWMGVFYKAVGLSVGVILHGISTTQRREAYACDVTYGTNSEFGFDYLRDNMASSLRRQVQRGLHYAIVDEVDSILIDEARTPLIISAPAEESTAKYVQYAQLVSQLQENVHFNKDEKQRTAVLTEEGIKKMEEMLGIENIYTEKGFGEVHHIEQALKAHAIFKRDVDYVAKNNEIVIVDEFTGRLMPGRRYSHGLHQAIEAKERVTVQRESRTLATITFQNYFRLFNKLAGMTGTAKTEEEEFESIYKLRTIVIPTHRAMIRSDRPDAIYRTVAGKFRAVAKIAKERYDKGQPVLIGTTSIEKSEAMSLLLDELRVPHQVLNAKQHEKEAEIVSNAGQKGTITIATNMAGRGTDIKLGEGVAELGGLVILGTERHESRRIDNQLRGRAGRQGDPGESQFFVSMEDDLMRLFGGDRLKNMMTRWNIPEDVPLENGMVSRSIEGAQKRVEGRNFDIRRHVLQYDDVMNRHRDIIYKRRQKILARIAEAEGGSNDESRIANGENSASAMRDSTSAIQWPLHDDVLASLKREAEGMVAVHAQGDDHDQWNAREIIENLTALHESFGGAFTEEKIRGYADAEALAGAITTLFTDTYQKKCEAADAASVARGEAVITLRSVDTHWMDHIDDMSHLREQVAFSGYAQRDPVIEYQDQGFRRFQSLLARIDSTIVRTLLQADFSQFVSTAVMLESNEEEAAALQTNEAQIEGQLTGDAPAQTPSAASDSPMNVLASGAPVPPQLMPRRVQAPMQRSEEKVGRNDPCPCGSGKKYKKCHGKDS